MPRVWLSLGSNLEREQSLRGAVEDLRRDFGDLVLSRVYEGEPVGTQGPAFYNLVVGLHTEQAPDRIHRRMRAIEDAHGRVRGLDKFAPRTLDIDILTYGDQILSMNGLVLPRDEILCYAFVLCPLAEVAGDEIHPEKGISYRRLWDEFDQQGQPLWPIDMAF